MSDLLLRLIERIRSEGLAPTLWRALRSRLRPTVVRRAFIMVADLSCPPEITLPDEQQFALCDARDAGPHLDALPEQEQAHALAQAPFADRLMTARIDGELAYWNWLQVDRADVPGDVLAALPEGSRVACLFGGFTRPGFRGRGLFTNGNRWLMRRLADEGFTHLFCRSVFTNPPSVRSRLKGGYSVMGEATTVIRAGKRNYAPTRLFSPPIPGSEVLGERQRELTRRGRLAARRALSYARPGE